MKASAGREGPYVCVIGGSNADIQGFPDHARYLSILDTNLPAGVPGHLLTAFPGIGFFLDSVSTAKARKVKGLVIRPCRKRTSTTQKGSLHHAREIPGYPS